MQKRTLGNGGSSAGQNASRKDTLLTRTGKGGGGRYDIIWAGSSSTGTAGTGTVSISFTVASDSGTATFSTSQSLTAGTLLRVGAASAQNLYEIVSGSGTSYAIKSRYLKARLATSLSGQSFWTVPKRTIGLQYNNNAGGSVPLMPNTPGSVSQNLGTTAFRVEASQNTDVILTHYLKASSTETATDGIMRTWANGELILEATNLGYGDYAFDIIEIPSVFNSPRQNQTEYIWDLVLWKP